MGLMQKKAFFILVSMLIIPIIAVAAFMVLYSQKPSESQQEVYWFVLHRKSQGEYLYKGVVGDAKQSRLVKTFQVKTGIPGERPTPLPQAVGREYWLLIKKAPSDNPETAPYFLTLNIPGWDKEPFGPKPYRECHGQCNWVLPGEFGLHGVNGDFSKLTKEDKGSSGCIRHTDADITYIYNLLHPESEEIRYYIEDR